MRFSRVLKLVALGVTASLFGCDSSDTAPSATVDITGGRGCRLFERQDHYCR